MPISRELIQLIGELESLIKCGQTGKAKQVNEKIWDIVQSTPIEKDNPEAALELLGSVALTIKKTGQMKMALPWFKQLCDFAGGLNPWSEDTAWDYYHYAECLEAVNRLSEAKKWFQNAETVLSISNSTNDEFADKIKKRITELNKRL